MSSQIINKISENKPLTQVIPALIPFIPFSNLYQLFPGLLQLLQSSRFQPRKRPRSSNGPRTIFASMRFLQDTVREFPFLHMARQRGFPNQLIELTPRLCSQHGPNEAHGQGDFRFPS
jgi:hypothetical protein